MRLPARRPAGQQQQQQQPQQRARAPLRVACRAAGGAAGAPPPPPPPPFSASARARARDAPAARLRQLVELAQEAARLAAQTGAPRAARRAAQAADAVLSLAREQAAALAAARPPDAPPALLRALFERLGATYIKLGQFIASSPTLFPPEYVLEFQKCLDAAPPVPFPAVRAVAEAELGCALEDVFESVDPVPLATASVAQVHAAVLRGGRKEVVLKVLKPGVEDTLTTDLNFLYLVGRAAEVAAPGLSAASLAGVLADIRAAVLDEADFRKEADNMAAFAAYLDRTPGARLAATVPELYRQHCSRRLLVMERLRGAPLTDLAAVRAATRGGLARAADPELVLIGALNAWLGSVVGAESFHADVHAGNLLVLPDGRVAFIDFGIVGRVAPPTWAAVEALLRAAAGGDYAGMARALVAVGAAARDVDVPAFAADLRALAEGLGAVDATVVVGAAGAGGAPRVALAADDAALNRLLVELVRVGEAHGVRFPREFALLLKQILYFDRYTRLLAPSLDMVGDARVNLGAAAAGGFGGFGGAGVVDI